MENKKHKEQPSVVMFRNRIIIVYNSKQLIFKMSEKVKAAQFALYLSNLK